MTVGASGRSGGVHGTLQLEKRLRRVPWPRALDAPAERKVRGVVCTAFLVL